MDNGTAQGKQAVPKATKQNIDTVWDNVLGKNIESNQAKLLWWLYNGTIVAKSGHT